MRAHGRQGYGKTTLLQEYELPVQTGARSDDLAETHPTEGMTKVIPALSCKHDNEERRSGSDDYLARRQLLRQRGGFIRASPIPPGHLGDPRFAIHEPRFTNQDAICKKLWKITEIRE